MKGLTFLIICLSFFVYFYYGNEPVPKEEAMPLSESSSKASTNPKAEIEIDKDEAVVMPVVPVTKHAKLCANPGFDLMATIDFAVEKFTGLNYSAADTSDCSGIFHRVLFEVKERCPEVGLPPFHFRSSRDIAKWYHDKGDFQFIKDPENSGHLIEKGVVMLYGVGGKSYDLENLTIDDLTKNGGIYHVALVVDVEKEAGEVVSYDVFHGLNAKKRSQITTIPFENPNHPEFPPYAYWNEPWLAVAKLLGSNRNRK